MNVAPALIGLLPKYAYSDIDEALAIQRACESAQNVEIPMPVIYGRGTQLGWVCGKKGSNQVAFVADRKPLEKAIPLWAAINNYSNIISACAAGKRRPIFWAKGATTNPVASNWYDLWPVAGNPAAGTFPGSAYTADAKDKTDVGSLPIGANVSSATKIISMVAGNQTAGATASCLWLYDRVVTYEACAFNDFVLRSMTNGSTPPGSRYSGTGESGMQIVVTGQTVFNTVQQFFDNYVYTDQDGNTGNTFTGSATTTSIIVSAAAPTATLGARVVSPCLTAAGTTCAGPFMPLNTGDTGVRYIESYTNSNVATANNGTMCFVLARPLFILPLGTANVWSMADAVNMVPNLEQIFDSACLSFLNYFPVATGCTFTGVVDTVWN